MAWGLLTIHSHQLRPSWGQRVSSAWSRGALGRVATSAAVTGVRAFPGCLAKGVDAADADRHPEHLPHDPGGFPAAQMETSPTMRCIRMCRHQCSIWHHCRTMYPTLDDSGTPGVN